MAKLITLLVVANPWLTLDHEGRPSAHITYLGTDRLVGGELDAEASRKEEDGRKPIYKFHEEPVALKVSRPSEVALYVRAIQSGALLAADAETARLAGVDFVPTADALRRAKEAAAATWEAETGRRPGWASAAAPKPPAAPAKPPPAAPETVTRAAQKDPEK